MLNVQVQNAQIAENAKHNRATEKQASLELEEQRRHNLSTEDVAFGTLGETAAHNRASEDIAWFNATESQRTHQANEAISGYQALEQHRHNLQTESETNRANLATEGWRSATLDETSTHNRNSEALEGDKNAINDAHYQREDYIGMQNAATNAANAQTRVDELNESIRHAHEQEISDRLKAEAAAKNANANALSAATGLGSAIVSGFGNASSAIGKIGRYNNLQYFDSLY